MVARRADGDGAGLAPHSELELFGRDAELALLERLVEQRRLVTIVGPAGVGKTRLALELARLQGQKFPTRQVVWVELQHADSAATAALAVGDALGRRLAPARSADDAVRLIGEALADTGDVLVVLDNFEHLATLAGDSVGRWLGAAERARFVVTSRRALRLAGEQRLPLDPLAPDQAVAMFVDRARLALPRLTLDDERSALIGELVERLDRLPLAVELAARHSAVLPPEEIVARVGSSLDLLDDLRDDGRLLDAHQRTLRRALDGSWALLSDEDRRALCACAVFRGGIPLDGLAAMLGSHADALARAQGLCDQSLLLRHPAASEGQARFELLQFVRDYAEAQTERLGIEGELRRAHAAYFARAAAAWSAPDGAPGPTADGDAQRIRQEMSNLLAASRFCQHEDPPAALRLVLALSDTLLLSGPYAELRALLDAALELADRHPVEPELRVRLLITRGEAHKICGDRAAAARDLHRAVQQAEAEQLTLALACALRGLGLLQRDEGEFKRAELQLERAAELFSAADNRTMLCHTTGNLATLYRQQGRSTAARAQYRRAAELARELGAINVGALALAGQGHIAAAEGDVVAAERFYADALPMLAASGDPRSEGIVLQRLATLRLAQDDVERALELLERSRERLALVADRINGGLSLGLQAVALALLSRFDEATLALLECEHALQQTADERLHASARGLSACVSAARARVAGGREGRTLTRRARTVLRSLVGPRGGARARQGAPDRSHVEYVSLVSALLEHILDGRPMGLGASSPLRVGDGWCELDGRRIDVGVGTKPARLLRCLADHRLRQPGVSISAATLFGEVWPKQRVSRAAAANRVHVVVRRLRQRGLTDVVVRGEGGYLLHPAFEVQLVD